MITITQDNIYYSPFSLKHTSVKSSIVEEVTEDRLVYYMGEDVEIGEDVTFGRIFDLIILHKMFFNVLFNAELDGVRIDDFILDYNKEFVDDGKKGDFKLKLYWNSDIFDYSDEVEYVDYVLFSAYGNIDKGDTEKYLMSIAFTSLSEIKNSLLFVDNVFEINDFISNIDDGEEFEDYDDDDEEENFEMGTIFRADYRPFTLYEIIGGILCEIAYYGKPEERDAQRVELDKRVEEIEKWKAEGTLEENTTSWNSVRDDIELNMDEDFVEEGDVNTFWNKLYPKSEYNDKKNGIDGAIMALSEGAGLSLEKQLSDAVEDEDYEKAAKIHGLIFKRDGKKH